MMRPSKRLYLAIELFNEIDLLLDKRKKRGSRIFIAKGFEFSKRREKTETLRRRVFFRRGEKKELGGDSRPR